MGIEWKGVDYVAKLRNMPGCNRRLGEYVNSIFMVRVLLASFLSVVMVAGIIFIPVLRTNMMLSFGFGLSVFVAAILADWVYMGLGELRYLVISRVIRSLSYLFLVVLFVSNQDALALVGFIYTSAFAVAAIFLLYVLYEKYDWRLEFSFRDVKLFSVIKSALPFLGQIYYLIGTIYIQGVSNERVTGLYAAAYRIIALLVPVGGYLITASYPYIRDGASKSITDMREILKVLMCRMLILSTGLTITCYVMAEQLIRLFYGDDYGGSVLFLKVLSVSIPFVLLSMLLGAFLNALGREREMMLFILVSLLSLFLVAVPLNYFMGFHGIVYAITFSTIVVNILALRAVYSTKHCKLSPCA